MMGVAMFCRADIDAQAIALNCMSCHRDQVNSETDIPSLAPLTESRLRQALLDFKYDNKPASLMPRIAKGYSDDELAAVATFIKRQ